MDSGLIAPCGMNCAVCGSYLAMKNDVKSKGVKMPYCIGCRARNKKCAYIKKDCKAKLLLDNKVKYCSECRLYPCDRLTKLGSRYQQRYKMSMVENLELIKKIGMEKFLKKEEHRWKCPKCGESICCHNGLCFKCDLKKLIAKKKKFDWD